MNIVVVVAVCRMLGLGVGAYVRRAFVAPCLAGAVLALGWWLTGASELVTTWRTWIMVGTLGTTGFVAIAALTEWNGWLKLAWQKRQTELSASASSASLR
jgi:hypothetical protein